MNKSISIPESPRRDRMIQERVHDPYRARRKPPEPTVCPECGAVFRSGRWQWIEPRPAQAHEELCQACSRVKDNFPAGVVTLSGKFARDHRDELIRLARHQEEVENEDHPLHRIMRIEETAGTLMIYTADIHLPHRIAEAIRHACKGEVETHYDEEGCFVRVRWNRED